MARGVPSRPSSTPPWSGGAASYLVGGWRAALLNLRLELVRSTRVAAGPEWVDWYNHRRLLAPIGNVPPAEAEARYHAHVGDQALAA